MAGSRMGSLRIGTSGWTYDGWRGLFYPENIPKNDWLRYYASRFVTTEINGSFYRTPSLEAVSAWRDQTPREFAFAWKASKFITHWKRLTAKCENSIELMETRLNALGPKTIAILFQLPAHFLKNSERLDEFLKMLPRRRRYAFEFRHKSWYGADILEIQEPCGAGRMPLRPGGVRGVMCWCILTTTRKQPPREMHCVC